MFGPTWGTREGALIRATLDGGKPEFFAHTQNPVDPNTGRPASSSYEDAVVWVRVAAPSEVYPAKALSDVRVIFAGPAFDGRMGIDDPDVFDALTKAISDKFDQICRDTTDGNWSRKSSGYRRGKGLQGSAAGVMEMTMRDGSHVVYFVEAHDDNSGRGEVLPVLTVNRWFHNSDEFWQMHLDDREGAVVIDGRHYRILPDMPSSQRGMAGFGGRLHRIRFLADGRVVESRNLWYQGVIPPAWRDRLPDTAEFLPAEPVAAFNIGEEAER